MTNSPVFSIIIPCYNYGIYLSETITSLQSQTFPYWECLIVDDASTDDSRLISSDFAAKDSRIRLLCHKKNKGLASSRNTGIQFARGEYIIFLDADDLLLASTFEKIINKIGEVSTGTDDKVIYCMPFRYFKKESELKDTAEIRLVTGLDQGYSHTLLRFAIGNPLPVCCAVVPMKLCKAGFVFRPGLRYFEDYAYWVYLIYNGIRFYRLPGQIYDWGACIRVHDSSLSCNDLGMYIQEIQLREKWDRDGIFAESHVATKENRRRLLNRAARVLLLCFPYSKRNTRAMVKDAWRILSVSEINFWVLPWVIFRAAGGMLLGPLVRKKPGKYISSKNHSKSA